MTLFLGQKRSARPWRRELTASLAAKIVTALSLV